MLNQSERKSGLIGLYIAAFFAIFVCFGLSRAPHASASAASSPEAQATRPAAYVTTAYFLNVRAEASNRSRIIDVVEKGTVLSVTGQSGKWLKLEGGGYVHGSYAKKVEGSAGGKAASAGSPDRASAPRPAPAVLKVDASQPAELRRPDSKVRSASGLTVERIRSLFDGTALEGLGLEKVVLEVEEEYGVNAFFTIAVMRLESGNGSSKVARTRNNLFGLNSSNGTGYLRFESKEASVRKFGQLIAKHYIGKGYTTIEKIARKYCPANSKWASLIRNVINRDYRAVV